MEHGDTHKIYHLGYLGGSGGFILLHFLLLSDQYFKNIFEGQQLVDVIDRQWNILDHKKWKHNEHWPNNYHSLDGAGELDRILFHCNPMMEDFFHNQQLTNFMHTHKIPFNKQVSRYLAGELACKHVWLYTDMHSQNQLAWYKQAYFYAAGPRKFIDDLGDRTAEWQGMCVDKQNIPFLQQSDLQIKLQDWVNRPELLVELGLIKTVNQQQITLLQRWKLLHAPQLLEEIGIQC